MPIDCLRESRVTGGETSTPQRRTNARSLLHAHSSSFSAISRMKPRRSFHVVRTRGTKFNIRLLCNEKSENLSPSVISVVYIATYASIISTNAAIDTVFRRSARPFVEPTSSGCGESKSNFCAVEVGHSFGPRSARTSCRCRLFIGR